MQPRAVRPVARLLLLEDGRRRPRPEGSAARGAEGRPQADDRAALPGPERARRPAFHSDPRRERTERPRLDVGRAEPVEHDVLGRPMVQPAGLACAQLDRVGTGLGVGNPPAASGASVRRIKTS